MASNNWKFEVCKVYLVYYHNAEAVRLAKPTCLLPAEREICFIINLLYFYEKQILQSCTVDVKDCSG